MRTTAEQTVGRSRRALGFSLRVVRWTTVLGGILVLLLSPGPARSATLPGPMSVTLAWDASASPNVAGYRLYYGVASRNYTSSIMVGNVTTNTISGLTPGVAYFFAVTAHDADGRESLFSDEVFYLPGIPTLQIHVTAAGQAVLTVRGLAGQTYEIEVTQDFNTWTAMGTVMLDAAGSLDFTDPNVADASWQFYRARVVQP